MKKLIQISIKLIQLLKKITNLLNELSFNSRPLSSNQSNIYNCKLNQLIKVPIIFLEKKFFRNEKRRNDEFIR